MTDVDELLRQDGERWRATATTLPHVDWSELPSRRRTSARSWRVAAGAIAVAAVVAALAIVVPSVFNGGTASPKPAHRPGPAHHVLGGPVSFIGLTRDGVGQADARTGDSRGMSVGEKGRRETALAVTDDGNVAYATYSHPRCTVGVVRFRWTSPTGAESTDAATIAGVKADDIAASPDGHLLAVAAEPCQTVKGTIDDLVVVNLDTHQQWRWTGHPDSSLISQLQWGPDNRTLAYVVTSCCGGGQEGPRLLDTQAPGRSYVKPRILPVDQTVGMGLVFWFRGRLAVVMSSEIDPLTVAGDVGKMVASGLPGDVVSIHADRTGEHLLLTTYDGRLFRWDDGVLTPLRGHWIDAGW